MRARTNSIDNSRFVNNDLAAAGNKTIPVIILPPRTAEELLPSVLILEFFRYKSSNRHGYHEQQKKYPLLS